MFLVIYVHNIAMSDVFVSWRRWRRGVVRGLWAWGEEAGGSFVWGLRVSQGRVTNNYDKDIWLPATPPSQGLEWS